VKAKLPESRPGYRALMQLLRTADSVWNASHAFFEKWDLGPSQFNVLNLLYQSPEGLSQMDLSRELIMHRSNVTGLVDRLEKRGLVARKEGADRRTYRVVLTRAGREVMQEVLPRYYEGAVNVWEGLSEQRAEEVIRELESVARNAERIGKSVEQPKAESRKV
jgi:MarR family 2-MHQ and catechol resistance regulon transcriptional repressor